MIKNISGTGISKERTVKITSHPEATNIHMFDYVKPELHYQPEVIVLHCGTNNTANEINALKKLKKLLK